MNKIGENGTLGRRMRGFPGGWVDGLWAWTAAAALSGPALWVWAPAEPLPGVVDHGGFPWFALAASIVVAGGSAALATVFGGLAAAALTWGKIPAGKWAGVLLLTPMLTPGTVWALGQMVCFGAGGLAEKALGDGFRPWLSEMDEGRFLSTVAVLAQIHLPIAMLLLLQGFRKIHHAGYDAARLYLPGRKLAGWLVEAVKGEAAAAFLLTFALSLGNFAAPHVLQCPLYPIEVFLRMNNYADREGAVWMSLPLTAAALAAAAGCAWLSLGLRNATAAAEQETPAWRSKGLRRWAAVGVWGYLGLTTLAPAAALAAECRSWELFTRVVREAGPETERSLMVAASAAALAAGAGWLAGRWWADRGSSWMGLLVLAPMAMPTIVLGLGYVRFYNRTTPVDLTWVSDSSLLSVLGLAARSWPFAACVFASGRLRQAPEWRDAARLAPIGRWRRFWWITAPLSAADLCAAWTLAFVLSLGDVEISQMLVVPGGGTLSLRLFTFLHFGPAWTTAGLAMLLWLLSAVPVGVYFLTTDREVDG